MLIRNVIATIKAVFPKRFISGCEGQYEFERMLTTFDFRSPQAYPLSSMVVLVLPEKRLLRKETSHESLNVLVSRLRIV